MNTDIIDTVDSLGLTETKGDIIENDLPTEEEEEELDIDNEEGEEEEGEELPKYKVVINGVEEEVTLKDLTERYQKEHAAEKKFQEAANVRKQADAEFAKYIENQELMQRAAVQLQHMSEQLALLQPQEPDWQTLLNEQPHEYLKQKEIFEKRNQAAQQLQIAQAYLTQQQQEAEMKELETRVASEKARLLDVVLPEWKDDSVREREQNELYKYLTEVGYSQQDVISLSYSRAENIALARKAMLYDRAKAKAKANGRPDTSAANPVPTVGKKSQGKPKRNISDPDTSYDDFVRLRREQIKNRR